MTASRRPTAFLYAEVAATGGWAFGSLLILSAFHIDYWGAVRLFSSWGARVSTSVDGSPMPMTSAFDAILWASLPLGMMGACAAAAGLARRRAQPPAPLLVLFVRNAAIACGGFWLLCR